MAKLTACKTCGGQVAKSAKACPHCGAPVRQSSLGALVGAILLIGGALLLING